MPAFYDVGIDEYRDVTQKDWDHAHNVCEAYFLAHKIVRYSFRYKDREAQSEKVVSRLRELLAEFEGWPFEGAA